MHPKEVKVPQTTNGTTCEPGRLNSASGSAAWPANIWLHLPCLLRLHGGTCRSSSPRLPDSCALIEQVPPCGHRRFVMHKSSIQCNLWLHVPGCSLPKPFVCVGAFRSPSPAQGTTASKRQSAQLYVHFLLSRHRAEAGTAKGCERNHV